MPIAVSGQLSNTADKPRYNSNFKAYWLLFLAITALLYGCDSSHEMKATLIKSEIVIENDDTRFLLGHFKWLNNSQIIVTRYDHSQPLPLGGGIRFLKLVVWDTLQNKLTALPYSDVGGLCMINGNTKFFTRKITPDKTGVRSYIDTRQYYQGVVGDFKPIDLIQPIDPITCNSNEDKSSLPAWAQSIDSFNIIRLKPEHGFIWIDRNTKDLFQKPKGFWLYPPNANKDQGIDISRILIDSVSSSLVPGAVTLTLKYYDYQQAYLYTTPNSKTWWIYPDGKLEHLESTEIRDERFARKRISEATITKVGVVFGTSDFVSLKIDKNDGLYLKDGKKNIKRLVSGRIGYELEVSPDGCKLAYGIDRNETLRAVTVLNLKLEVIDLCKLQ